MAFLKLLSLSNVNEFRLFLKYTLPPMQYFNDIHVFLYSEKIKVATFSRVHRFNMCSQRKVEVKKSMLAINNNCASSLLPTLRPVTTTSRFMAWLGASRRRESGSTIKQHLLSQLEPVRTRRPPWPPRIRHLLSFNWSVRVRGAVVMRAADLSNLG